MKTSVLLMNARPSSFTSAKDTASLTHEWHQEIDEINRMKPNPFTSLFYSHSQCDGTRLGLIKSINGLFLLSWELGCEIPIC